MQATHQYQLENYRGPRSRHTCPGCGKKGEFVRYVDAAGQYIADNVGKCNRANNCKYHYPPAVYFAEHPQGQAEAWRQSELWQTAYTPPPAPKPITYLPAELMAASCRHVAQSNLYRYLITLFGEVNAARLADLYHLGASAEFRNAGGLATAFWQVDELGHIRQIKAMAYDPTIGRRLKDHQPAERRTHAGNYRPTADGEKKTAFLGKRLAGQDANLAQCLYGAHLIPQFPALPICVVESEKTAIVLAGIKTDCIWIATGGKHGAKWIDGDVYACLADRHVILYPDLGAFDTWKDRAKLLATVAASVTVSDLLEGIATDDDRAAGLDLADYFTRGANVRHGAQIAQDERTEAEAATTSPQTQDAPHRPGLPQGFKVIPFENGGTTFEIDGLPMTWLSDAGLQSAIARMKGHEREVMHALRPDELALLDAFGFEIESISSL